MAASSPALPPCAAYSRPWPLSTGFEQVPYVAFSQAVTVDLEETVDRGMGPGSYCSDCVMPQASLKMIAGVRWVRYCAGGRQRDEASDAEAWYVDNCLTFFVARIR